MAGPILVPLDGSLFSERALPMAEALARASGAVLHVVRIHVPHTRPPVSLEGMPVADPDKNAQRWAAERAYVSRIRNRLGPRSELATRIAVLHGAVAEALAKYAAAHRVGLIVMSSHGRRGLARTWMGSIGDALLRSSGVPVLLVRPGKGRETSAVPDGPPTILIALDGSPLSEQILEHAVSVGRPLGARYVMLRVVNPPGLMGEMPAAIAPRLGWNLAAASRVAEARAYLSAAARPLKERGLEVETKVIESERPAAAILHEAVRGGSALVAMASHGRTGLSRLVLGSVASQVLHGASVPLLLYRPTAEHRALRAQPMEVAAAL
jgi:nucleotide-binding universal stress UspA family protein